mgnify:CR=1 FL=1
MCLEQQEDELQGLHDFKQDTRQSSKIGANFLVLNRQNYLLTVDYHSKWPEVEKLDKLSSGNVITNLEKQFAWFGYIDELLSDNGLQFSSEEF